MRVFPSGYVSHSFLRKCIYAYQNCCHHRPRLLRLGDRHARRRRHFLRLPSLPRRVLPLSVLSALSGFSSFSGFSRLSILPGFSSFSRLSRLSRFSRFSRLPRFLLRVSGLSGLSGLLGLRLGSSLLFGLAGLLRFPVELGHEQLGVMARHHLLRDRRIIGRMQRSPSGSAARRPASARRLRLAFRLLRRHRLIGGLHRSLLRGLLTLRLRRLRLRRLGLGLRCRL